MMSASGSVDWKAACKAFYDDSAELVEAAFANATREQVDTLNTLFVNGGDDPDCLSFGGVTMVNDHGHSKYRTPDGSYSYGECAGSFTFLQFLKMEGKAKAAAALEALIEAKGAPEK
mmetsp:Transcript_83449/g.231604  ORF Transcript_83449/g.231604 Transcript_83449/m.231604 type:complete len:117 (-) Transcript_83449:102-452(-)